MITSRRMSRGGEPAESLVPSDPAIEPRLSVMREVRGHMDIIRRHHEDEERQGHGSAHVVTEITCDGDGDRRISIATKCHPVSRYPTDWHFGVDCVLSELRVLARCTRCVELKVTPNLPINYRNHVGPTRVTGRYGVKDPRDLPAHSYYSINEYANGPNLENWQMKDGAHSPEEWMSCFFQILAGAAVFNSFHVGMCHNDLHWGNVIMQRVRPGGCWHYRFRTHNGKRWHDYYVPNTGQQWRLWDFGFSTPYRRKIEDDLTSLHDVENVIMGCFDFAKEEHQHPVLRGGMCKHKMEKTFRKVENVYLAKAKRGSMSANINTNMPLKVIKKLGWFLFRNPQTFVVNADKPYELKTSSSSRFCIPPS